jgi:hypothetical protein
MPQALRPNSDIDSVWSCSTGSSRYACIDEDPYSDTDYIYQATTSNIQTIGLSPGETPANRLNHTLRFRVRGESRSGSLNAYLYQGSTLIKAWTNGNLYYFSFSTSWAEKTATLTESEAQAITDYSQLRLKFGASNQTARISWVAFEIPDAAAGGPEICLEMGCAA